MNRNLVTLAKDLCSKIRLNDGNLMPMFGLGMFISTVGDEAERAVQFALNQGYGLIDTSEYHGILTQKDIGKGIRNSRVDREDVFIVNKVLENGYDRCINVVHDSLMKMGLDYIDLYCIHTPADGKNIETYEAILQLKDRGLVKSVGVSNFGVHHLEELQKAGLPVPSVNQIELHPWQQKSDIVKYCRENGIVVMGYCPVFKGRKLNDDTLVKIAKRYNKTPAQILIRWSVQHGYITIPKSSNLQRIMENTDVFDWSINDNDINIMKTFPDESCSWNPCVTPWKG